MARYRCKPYFVEALRWDGRDLDAVRALLGPRKGATLAYNQKLETEEVTGLAILLWPGVRLEPAIGDWLVRKPDNTIESIGPNEFAEHFEEVSEQ